MTYATGGGATILLRRAAVLEMPVLLVGTGFPSAAAVSGCALVAVDTDLVAVVA